VKPRKLLDRRKDSHETKLVAPDTKPRRILLVEDHDDIREMIATALRGQGYQVDHAALPDEGIALLRKTAYDLVVSHYNLPGKTAADMLNEAAGEGLLKGTPTLVVTAHPDPHGVEPTSIIRKPLDVTKFLLQIQKIFSSGSLAAAPPERRVAGASRRTQAATVELVLYVNKVWVTSIRARENLEKVLEDYVGAQVRLKVCDVADDALAAEEDQVVFTPTLVKRSPPPRAWVIGDLSDLSVVTSLLDMSGVERRRR
jgi:CheY-like chemotaxis protein